MVARPVQALAVVPVESHLQIRVGGDVVKIGNHQDVIWSLLRFSDGRRSRSEVIAAALRSSRSQEGLFEAVMGDLERLGVLVDSRKLYPIVMGYSDNPMPYPSDMRSRDYVDYEHQPGWEPTGERFPLPQVSTAQLQVRRSCRAYDNAAVSLGDLSSVLRSATHRPPSAGALYPIRLVLLLNRKTGELGPGIYHYASTHHSLVPGPETSNEELRHALNREDGVYNAPAVLLIAGDMDRQCEKYSNRGWRYTLIEAGIATDRIVNAADEIGLGSLVFGGYDDTAMNRLVFGCDDTNVRSIVTVALGHITDELRPDRDLEALHDYVDREFVGPGRLVVSAGPTDLWRRPGDLSFHQVLATTAPKSGDDASSAEDRTCGGTGASIIAARAKAIVECIERDVSGVLRVDRTGPATEVNPDFDLSKFVPLTAEQIAAHEYLQAFDPGQNLQWSVATNLATRAQEFVPVDLVYYPLSTKTLGRRLLQAANSSGVASHTDPLEAQHRALLELLERHAVLTSWHRQTPPTQVPETAWGNYLRRRRSYWASQGIKLRVLDYTIDGVPIAGVVITDASGTATFAFGSAAAITWEAAVNKAFQEAEVGVAAQRSLGEKAVSLHDVATPLDHGRFHAYDSERTAWSFLSSGQIPARWAAPNPLCDFTNLYDIYQPLAIMIDSPPPISTCRVLSPRIFPISFGTSLEHRPAWSVAPNVPHFIA